MTRPQPTNRDLSAVNVDMHKIADIPYMARTIEACTIAYQLIVTEAQLDHKAIEDHVSRMSWKSPNSVGRLAASRIQRALEAEKANPRKYNIRSKDIFGPSMGWDI